MNNTALIRHEITDRALMLVEVWDDQILDRIDTTDNVRGPVPSDVLNAVETALNAMYDAVRELAAWEDAATEPEAKP